MSHSRDRTFLGRACTLLGLALLFGATSAVAQDTGIVRGTVIALDTGQPLAGAQVTIAGTQLGTLTGPEGNFTISNAPAGEQRIRATFIGYATSTQEVVVAAGQTHDVNFQLRRDAIGLEGITVTAFGEQRVRREIGNVTSRISTDDIELPAINTFSSMLQGRAAGVTVGSSGGTVGTGARIRIRGANSVSLSNEPLIVVDGVRMDNSPMSTSIGVGGQGFSRFEDLNPEDIESIEIVKGPAAAALYGTAGANGVLQITTRRGLAGAAQWTVYTELGVLDDPTTYPANWGAWTTVDGSPTLGCTLLQQAEGVCQQDSLAVWNPIEETGAVQTGNRQRYGLNVSGGTADFQYFLSGDFSDEQGVFEVNTRQAANLRANFQGQVREDLNVAVSTGYVTNQTWLPQNDNNTLGLISGALLGNPIDGPGESRGYVLTSPENLNQMETGQNVGRLMGSLRADWQPLEWLSVSSTAGMDLVNREDEEFTPPNTIFFGAQLPTGTRQSNRINVSNYTWNAVGRASYELSPTIRASTGLSAEFTRDVFEGTYASASGLLPGTRSLLAASDNFAVSEQFADLRTVGAAIEQRLAFNDRIFLNAAIRADDDNSFGDQLDLIFYPSASASWVMSEEDWFPAADAMDMFRLRAAFGRSGLRPGFRDAILYFTPETVNVDDQNVPGFSVGGAGNPDLRPEISTEFEFGFDTGFMEDRIGLELTYFTKRSRDALVQRRLAPSLGATVTRFENIGEVRNTGFEGVLGVSLVERDRFNWNASLSGSYTENELTDLGDVEPIIFGLGGDSQRHQEGYPLGGMWGLRLIDFNVPEDGIVTPADVTLSEEEEFFGPSMPTREVALSMDFTLFDMFRISTLLDHQGGHYLNNSTRFFRCGSAFLNCREAFDPASDPEGQARSVAARMGARGAYFERADFTKLRELSLTFMVPQQQVERFGVSGMAITVSGRNLATWTDYTGFDPEVNFAGQANFSTADFLTQPPLRHWTARVSLNF